MDEARAVAGLLASQGVSEHVHFGRGSDACYCPHLSRTGLCVYPWCYMSPWALLAPLPLVYVCLV